MKAVLDSSTLISLAWAGQLDLLRDCPLGLIVPAEVQQETVAEGRAGGHVDAVAIEAAIAPLEVQPAGAAGSADAAVLALGRSLGTLITNDVALRRRAANLGAGWLRTADLVVLCARSGRIDSERGLAALQSLYSAGRITADLLGTYRKELE